MSYDLTEPKQAVIDEMTRQLASLGVSCPGISIEHIGRDGANLIVTARPNQHERRSGRAVVALQREKRVVGMDEKGNPIAVYFTIITDQHLSEAASKLKPKGKTAAA